MRDIKFRAWQSQEKKMYVQGDTVDENRNVFWDIWENSSHISEPMQFTGLKDRNGVDIYEGDVVKYHDHPTGIEDGVGKVYYKDGKWMVTWSIIPLGDFGTAWVEVIGNIYQNHELLTTPNRG